MNPSRQGSFAARGLAVLQSVGGWVAIHPEQTYVATSIRGLGACKSTFCPAERCDLPPARRAGSGLVPLLAALAAAAGILSACATSRPFSRDVTELGQIERAPADCQIDCQNRAAPVTGGVAMAIAAPGASAADGKSFAQTAGQDIAGVVAGSSGAARAADRTHGAAIGEVGPVAAR
jgi:predicted small secreted protein